MSKESIFKKKIQFILSKKINVLLDYLRFVFTKRKVQQALLYNNGRRKNTRLNFEIFERLNKISKGISKRETLAGLMGDPFGVPLMLLLAMDHC